MEAESAEQRARFLRWPEERCCTWDCPWPSYCIDCHVTAHNAMLDARRRVVSALMNIPLEEMGPIAHAASVAHEAELAAKRRLPEDTMRVLGQLPAMPSSL